MKRSLGFTTIEMLVAISVMAILASLAIPSYLDFFEKSRLRGAAEAVYEQLQYARTESIKKSMPIIVDFSANNTTTWSLGITDTSTGCDATVTDSTDPTACVIEYDNNPLVDYGSDGISDKILMRLASTDFRDITMKGSGGDAPSFGTSAGPGACATIFATEACFEPVQGLARSSSISHIQLKSSNNTYTLQVEVDAVGRIKICVPSGKFIGYEGC